MAKTRRFLNRIKLRHEWTCRNVSRNRSTKTFSTFRCFPNLLFSEWPRPISVLSWCCHLLRLATVSSCKRHLQGSIFIYISWMRICFQTENGLYCTTLGNTSQSVQPESAQHVFNPRVGFKLDFVPFLDDWMQSEDGVGVFGICGQGDLHVGVHAQVQPRRHVSETHLLLPSYHVA